MQTTKTQQKAKKAYSQANVLETLRQDLGGNFVKTLGQEAGKIPADFMNQLLGRRMENRSGEIKPGQSIEMSDVITGKEEQKQKLEKQVSFERRLRLEQDEIRNKETHELRVQLNTIVKEMKEIVAKTPNLDQELQTAVMQAEKMEPTIFFVVWAQKLLKMLRDFKKKIEDASTWLQAVNQRSAKKGGNAWGKRYQKHGAKYLLSSEHYLTRSAG